MTADELASLADDIAVNGQHDPITLGRINGAASAVLVDGRNRLRACEIAGVAPKFDTRDFADDAEVVAFVRSRSERRDLSKGERAMGVALLYPEPEKGGRGKHGKNLSESEGFSPARLSQARAVLAHSRALAEAVRDGTVKLDEALQRVKDERAALDSTEAQKARLQSDAGDLADLVRDERLTLKDAIAALNERIDGLAGRFRRRVCCQQVERAHA
jgi:hypothetical protein